MAITYTKLKSGDWGIRADEPIAAGSTVTVTKRDGGTKTETIDRIIWTGDGVTLASIKQKGSTGTAAPRTASRSSRGSYRGRRTGCSCGSIEGVFRESDCWQCRHDA